jgi:ankyrin repeat protein
MLDRTLERLTISQPCDADWDSMTGNDQIRFCEHCSLHVNDLSAMTRNHAMRLINESRGRLCVRYVQLPNGRIATSDVPAKLYRIGRRASRIAAGAFTAAISLSTAPAQSRHPLASRESTTVELIQTLRQRELLIDEFTGALFGTIRTREGTPIPDATLFGVDRESGEEQTAVSSSLGSYEFQLLPAGDYLVWARQRGFTTSSEQIQVSANTRSRNDIELRELSRFGVMGGVGFRMTSGDPLVLAISDNAVEKVRSLAFTDPDLNAPGRSNGWPVLAAAVQRGNREIVGILLAAGANVNVRNSSGQAVLMSLAEGSTVELVRDLLGAGAKVNARDDFGDDALMNAAGSNSAAVLRELIIAGARVGVTNPSGETALFPAARYNNPEAVKLLLDFGAQVNAQNEEGETPLLSMATSGKVETLKLLIERGADIQHADMFGRTAIMNAVMNQDPELVRFLIEAGADINAKDLTDNSALMRAAETGHEATVALLATAGAELNGADDRGQTALMQAAARGQVESVRALLQAGADITLKDQEGNTALSLARYQNREDVIELLKLHGARE